MQAPRSPNLVEPARPLGRRATGQSRQRPSVGWLTLPLILSVVGCEYNADVQVPIPRWSTITPFAVLGIHPRADGAPEEGLYPAVDCEAEPDELSITFFIANERDEAVRDGDRLNVAGETIKLSAARLDDVGDPVQNIFVQLNDLDTGTGEFTLSAELRWVRWRAPPAGVPARVTLLHDHSFKAGENDPDDERVAALAEFIDEALCIDSRAVNCALPEATRLSLYKHHGADLVDAVLQRSNDYDLLAARLDDLRNAGEQGDALLFGADSGIEKALGECSGVDVSSTCWPLALLVAGDVTDEQETMAYQLLTAPEGTRLFLASLGGDSPSLRRLACQTGGFFKEIKETPDLRMRVERTGGDILDIDYGLARHALLAAAGFWEVRIRLLGLPGDLDMTQTYELSGALGVTLGDTSPPLAEFRTTIGGY